MAFGTSKANTAPEIDISKLSGEKEVSTSQNAATQEARGKWAGLLVQVLMVGWVAMTTPPAKASEITSLPDYIPTAIANTGDLPQYAAASTGTKTDAVATNISSGEQSFLWLLAQMDASRETDTRLSQTVAEMYRISHESGLGLSDFVQFRDLNKGNIQFWVNNIAEAPKKSFSEITGTNKLSDENIEKVMASLYNLNDLEGWLRTPSGEKAWEDQLKIYRANKTNECARWLTKIEEIKKTNPSLAQEWISTFNKWLPKVTITTREAYRRLLVQTYGIAEDSLSMATKNLANDPLTRLTNMSEVALLAGSPAQQIVTKPSVGIVNWLIISPETATTLDLKANYDYLFKSGALGEITDKQIALLKKIADKTGRSDVGSKIDGYVQQVKADMKAGIAAKEMDTAAMKMDTAAMKMDTARNKQESKLLDRTTQVVNRLKAALDWLAATGTIDAKAFNADLAVLKEIRENFTKIDGSSEAKTWLLAEYEKFRKNIEAKNGKKLRELGVNLSSL